MSKRPSVTRIVSQAFGGGGELKGARDDVSFFVKVSDGEGAFYEIFVLIRTITNVIIFSRI